ncbi:hypothetical protein QN360_17475, partial [Glaciimonas sp. CA11.2]|uniref:hypothetical protein n=1 Tax=Glaciimonas sp. CA11.2 TaxID=3048601 RepID=UPI002B23B923
MSKAGRRWIVVCSLLFACVVCMTWWRCAYLPWLDHPLINSLQNHLFNEKVDMAQTEITIRLGQQGQDWAKMYPRQLKVN